MAQPSNGKSHGQAAFEKGTFLNPWEFDLNPLGDFDVEIKITHSGVCHSDIHTINGDWGPQTDLWPIVPGHEILGLVSQVGSKVTRVQVGDRAGVGPQSLSCGHCHLCDDHRENYCTEYYETYASKLPNGFVTKGGYAQYNRTDEKFVVKIPDALPSAEAAPLLCAGITTYAPLKYAGVKAGSKVAVVGIGGLGHLALQFAAALGAEVTAISSSLSKKAEAESFGAKHFIDSSNKEEFRSNRNKFDVVINTTSVTLDWAEYFGLVAHFGRWYQLGAPPGLINIPPGILIHKNLAISGSLIGSPSETEEMLQFAADHKVLPLIETTPLSEANAALQRVADNKARYRIVLLIE